MSLSSLTSRLKPTFRVPATRGRMGTTKYYTATLPFGAVVKLFTFDPDQMLELTPENRSQRALNTRRIPEIASYVLDHEDYIFSAITVSVDSDEVAFEPVEPEADIGELVLPLEAKYVINDGQHRVAGISEALRRDSALAEDTISVVVLPDGGLERSQQIFSDLNRTVHKTSKSLDILFDHRLPINRITMACVEEVPLFKDRIDKERVSLSVRSARFATLSGLQQANVQLLGNLPENLPESEVEEMRSLAVDFWVRLTDLVVPWRDILEGDTKPQHARQVYVSSYALSLWALGFAGAAARAAYDGSTRSWFEVLDGLSGIDWRKTNRDWQGICMAETEVVTRAPTRRATARYIMWKLGLETERPATVIAEDRFARASERGAARAAR
ncbi:MAG: DGQHR domain-containing protein [Acidimicrobiaceae bacterium]|nr:DNA sulfur modification protein DndB [Acidimicrobiaceae bacterium]MXZ51730.1 DGQHR domain-containing protein [Acidimicrobiaceae bacterium]